MLLILEIHGRRCDSNPLPTPQGHWVGIAFRNENGVHLVELNGRTPLPADPALRADLEYLLWDFGLLSQQESASDEERVLIAQSLWNIDRNHGLARRYLERLGAPLVS